MRVAVILAAAGVGRRFAAQRTGRLGPLAGNKLDHPLRGRAVFLRSVELFVNRPEVGQVILAVHPRRLDDFRLSWGDKLGFLGVDVVAGGERERWETVQRALEHVDSSCTHVAVHDAARPLTPPDLIERVFEAARAYPAVIPGVPIAGTLKRVTDEPADPQPLTNADARVDDILGTAGQSAGTSTNLPPRRIVETVDRTGVVEAQTPQVFERDLLRRAYQQMTDGKTSASGVTDDAALIEAIGVSVRVVPGDPVNLKITRPEDIGLAEAVLAAREPADARRRLFADDDD